LKRLLSLLLAAILMTPNTLFALPNVKKISVRELSTYIAEINPLTGSYTLEYKSTITVKNDGESVAEHRFTQRLFRVNASTLELPKEARLIGRSGDFCLVEWIIQAKPGENIFEIRGRPLWTPLSIDVETRVNGVKPVYSSAYSVFFVESKENDTVEWRIRLRNNNSILLDPETNISSKPPVFVSASITLPEKYFRNIAYDPPFNMTSMLEKDTVSWIFILKDDAEINVKAVIGAFDDWGTIPLTPISISFSPMGDSVRESLISQLKSLNMSISMMDMFLTPLSNLTEFVDLMKSMLGNLSSTLEFTGNQTVAMSGALGTIGSELGNAASQLSEAASMLSTLIENISKVDFNQIRTLLNSSKDTASNALNETLGMIADVGNDLLEVREILVDLRSNLTDPNQTALINRAIEKIDSLYNRSKNFEHQLESASSQIDSLFNSLLLFVKVLEEYRSKMVSMGSKLSTGFSGLSRVSSALLQISSALRRIGEANMMIGENMSSMMPLLENASSSMTSIRESLENNMTSLRRAYDELSTFIRLMDYGENLIRLSAPEVKSGESVIFKPVVTKDEECLRLDSIMFDNDTRIGVRTIKVYYNGTFKGVLLKNSTVAQSLVDLGIEVSDGSVAITQLRTHSRGNVLTLWNGQELSLLFSNNSEITVVVDYSILENLGEKSEALSYSVVQPTLGKGLSIIVKPGGETQPLKTSLNMLTIVLLAASIAVVIVLLYAFRRKREIIIV
jgi:anion-transporting  ArsA/GET3 family ATPase